MDCAEDLHLLTRNLGFDHSQDSYAAWTAMATRRGVERVRALVAELDEEANRSFFPRGVTAEDINEDGWRYLAQRTHFVRYGALPEHRRRYRDDLRLNLAVAAAVSGQVTLLRQPDFGTREGVLLEGTNLFVAPRSLA